MSSNNIQQVGTQKLGYGFAQMSYLGASCPINTMYSQVPRKHISCLIPMTFSQKMYQFLAVTPKAQEIADNKYEQALTEANNLEKVNNLLSEIVSLAN